MKKKMKSLTAICMALALLFSFVAVPVPAYAASKLKVTVTTPKTASLSGKTLTTFKGKQCKLKVKYGKKIVTKKAKYKSSKKSIFTVSKKGVIKAKKKGRAYLTIKYKKKKLKYKITVINPIYVEPVTGSNEKPCSHNWQKNRTTSAPTCQKTGIDLYICSKCKKTKNVTTPKTGHVYVNHICKYCGKSNIAKVNPTIAPPANRWPYAKKLFSPSTCPQHFWEYDHCFYCNAPNPKPGINKGWDMSKKADHEHAWEGVLCGDDNKMVINTKGQVIMEDQIKYKETHRCKLCGIEEPYIATERCNKCPLVWSSLEHPHERGANGEFIPYSTQEYKNDHINDHTDGQPSVAAASIYMADPYFCWNKKGYVHNPLYMQSNITGKTVWDTLGLAGKVWASYDTTRMNNIHHHTEDAWTAIPKLVNW